MKKAGIVALCLALLTFYISYGYFIENEPPFLPPGWVQIKYGGVAYWEVTNETPPNFNSYYLRISGAAINAEVFTPPMNLSNESSVTLECDMYLECWNGFGDAYVKVYSNGFYYEETLAHWDYDMHQFHFITTFDPSVYENANEVYIGFYFTGYFDIFAFDNLIIYSSSKVYLEEDFDGYGWTLQWNHSYGGYGHSQHAQPIGDIDEDGINEIIIGGYEEYPDWGRARILSYNASLNTYVEEYSWYEEGGAYHSPSGSCILDLDGDGDLEFCVSWTYSGDDGVYAYDWDGNNLTQLDAYLCSQDNELNFIFDVYACDYDDDGDIEVIVANAPTMAGGNSDKHVIALGWNATSNKFVKEASWGLAGYENMECPMVWHGDTDGDGKTEVIAVISEGATSTAGTWALNWNDTTKKWEEEIVYANYTNGTVYGVCVGDLNGNGIPEIGTGNNGGTDAYIFEWNGSGYEIKWHESWIGESDIIEAVAIGDADNVGINEFCVGTNYVHIIQWNGSNYFEKTCIASPPYGRLAGIVIGDCDTDGLNEMKATEIFDGGDGSEYIFKHYDEIPPEIYDINISPSSQFTGYSVNISCIVKDNVKVDIVKIYLTYPDGSHINKIMEKRGNIYFFNSTYYAVGNYTFYIRANDIYENAIISALYNFLIKYMHFNFNFSEGWNFITLPLENEYNASILYSSIPNCIVILKWNASKQQFEIYIPHSPYNFNIENGIGYFIAVNNASSYNIYGYPIRNVSIYLYEGWNALGWFKEKDTHASSLYENITGCNILLKWNNSKGNFDLYVPSSPYNFKIRQGDGFLVAVDEQSIWHGEG